MSRQQVEHPQSSNSSGRRKTEKETGIRANKKLVTGKSTSGLLMGENASGNGSPLHERLVYLTTCLIGHPVEVQVRDGSIFSGIFHATDADRDFGIILKMGRLMKTGSSNGQTDIFNFVDKSPSRTLIIPARELVQVMAKGVSVTRDGLVNELQHKKQQEIMTDSSISQSRHVEVERELGRWVPDDDDPECPELDNIFDGPWNRSWDQFEVNETLFGVKSTFDEDLYTTKLDRGPQMRELEREALRIAREIEGEDTQYLHMAEERGLQLQGNYEMDEEARFSSVFRGADDSGYDEKENLFDLRNIDTFADVSGSDLVKSSQPITGIEQDLVQEFQFSDILASYTNEESETPNLPHEARASKSEYSHPSSRPKKTFSDKVGLSPNAAAYDPTSSMSHGKNSSSNTSKNATSVKEHESAQSMNTRAQPGNLTSSTLDCGNAVPASTNTRLSPSSSVGSLASERSTLNPHAKEFKFNPNAKSFTPTKTSFRPASPVSDGSLNYSTNAPNVPHIHGLPASIGMGQSFSSHQPVMFNPRAAPMQSPQAYYYPNGSQYEQQQMLLGQPRQVHYMQTYSPEVQYKGRQF